MLKGINEWSFAPEMPLRQRMALARDAGFEAIEVALTEDDDEGSQSDLGLLCVDSYQEDARRIVQMAETEGIQLSGLASGLYWAYSLTSDDPDERVKALDITRILLRAASALGVDGVLVIPGNVHSEIVPDCPVVSYDAAWERALGGIGEVAPLAEKLGVSIGLEAVWNKFLLSPLEMRRFIEEIDSERVGFYMDTGNVMASGFPDQWIRILGDHIVRVHFKDFKRSMPTLDGFCDLLEGDANWPAIMEALADVGYDGPVAAEMVPPYQYAPDQLIYSTSRAMDYIFDMAP